MCDYIYYNSPPKSLGYDYPVFGNKGDHYVEGGFPPIATDNPGPGITDMGLTFPPPPNSAYELDSHCRLPRLHRHIYPDIAPIYHSTGPGARPQLAMRLQLTEANIARLEELTEQQQQKENSPPTVTDTESEGLMMKVKSSNNGGAQRTGQQAALEPGLDGPPAYHDLYSTQNPPGDYFNQQPLTERMATNLRITDPASPPQSPPLEVRPQDFLEIDEDNNDGSGQPDYCKICKKTHIPHGGPVRRGGDPKDHFSRLPAWFPRTEKGKPLESFEAVMKELVTLQEYEKYGYPPGKSDPEETWDLHFHDKSRHWSTKHARDWGGWWKCRSTADAPIAEKECVHCHRQKSRAQLEEEARLPPLKVKIQFLREYLDHHSGVQGRKERAVALAMMRRDGIPNYFNKPMSEKERLALMDCRPGIKTSATNRPIGPRLLDDAAKITLMNLDKRSMGEGYGSRVPLNSLRKNEQSFFLNDFEP